MGILKDKKILVVDDEELIREILRDMFEFEGAKVFESPSGYKALEILRANPIDVVVTDVRMPQGDGVTLAKEVTAQFKNPPKIFFFTGYSDIGLDQVKQYGVVDIISKPISGKSLVQIISEGISR